MDNARDKVLRGRCYNGDHTKRASFRATKALIREVACSTEGSVVLARRLGVSKPTVLKIRKILGIASDKKGPPRVAQQRVYDYLASAAIDGEITISQTSVGAALRMPSSNVNVAIRHLENAGRVSRLNKVGSVWKYRVA